MDIDRRRIGTRIRRVKVNIDSRVATLNKRGRALLKLSCSGDPCKGELTLGYKRSTRRAPGKKKRENAKTLVVSRTNFSISEGKSQRIWVVITKTGRNAIKRAKGHQLEVLATALVGPKSKPTTVAKRRLKLKAYTPLERRRH